MAIWPILSPEYSTTHHLQSNNQRAMSKYTNAEIAADYSLWMEYADPSGEDSQEGFEARSLEENIAILERCGFSDREPKF